MKHHFSQKIKPFSCKSNNPSQAKPSFHVNEGCAKYPGHHASNTPSVQETSYIMLDFVSPGSSPTWYNKHFRPDRRWYRFAWTFLIVKDNNGTLHVSKKVQLQLLKPLVYKVSSNAASTDVCTYMQEHGRTTVNEEQLSSSNSNIVQRSPMRTIACGNVGPEHHEIVIYQLSCGLTLSYLRSNSGLIYNLDWIRWETIPYYSHQLMAQPGIPINSISLHPSGKKLLLHCRDCVLRLLNINAEVIIRQYSGIVNFQYLMKSCFSPCGTLISSGSEDGTVYIWYSDTEYKTTLSSLDLRSSTRHLDTDFQHKTTFVHGKSSDEDEGTHSIESSRSASDDPNSALHKLESSLTFGAAVEKTICLQRTVKKLDSVLHVEEKR